MRFRMPLMFLSMCMIAGCSHTIPETSSKPQPPPELGKAPPVIQPLNAAQKQAQAPESLLPVTLTADFTPIQKSIQTALPERFTQENHPLGMDYRWRFVREGEPDVFIQDGLVKYKAVYRGEIESTAARACRLDPLYPVIEGTGKLAFREQNQGLLVTMSDSQTFMSLKSESDTKCNMFNMPVKDQLAELLKQEALKQDIVESVERGGFTIPLNLIWEHLQNPMPVGSGNSKLCLYGKAKDFTVGSMKGPLQRTTIKGFVRQTPIALYETTCQGNGVSPMNVKLDNTAAAVPEDESYRILLSVPVPYAVLNQQLQDQLYHQEVKLPTTFGNSLMIERVVASDVSGRTLLTAETSGNLNGRLYYWGTPQLEDNGNVIRIPDLQIANETKTALEDIKNGYWQMVDDQLRPRLRQATTVDLSQRIGNMKSALSGPHKSGAIDMDLLIARQEASQVMSRKDALVADVVLEGTASAVGRLPLKQATDKAMERAVEKPTVDSAPDGEQPPKAASIPEEERR